MTHPFSGPATRGLCALVLAALLPAPSATAQATLLSGDHSVRGNLCVGASCNASVTFPDNADLLFQDSVLRTYFQDVEAFVGHAENDWEFVFNDIGFGGQNYFALRDVDANGQVFRIQSGAPTNAFFMAADGNIGLGTSVPRANLHIEDSSTATIRLNRNTSGGLPNASFDLDVTTSGFALRDNVNGNVPFVVHPDAAHRALEIQVGRLVMNDGSSNYDIVMESDTDPAAFHLDAGLNRIGMGTATPTAPLHVQRGDNTARLLIEDTGASGAQEMFKLSNNGGSYFTFDNTAAGTTWFFTHENAAPNRFIIADAVADGPEMTLTASGDLTIPGRLFTAGSCGAGCDRVFDADYPLPSIPEQAAMMKELKHLPAVGPTPEDGPFNITAMTGGMLNELEKAHLYIAELEGRLAAQEARDAQSDALLADLLARIDRIETGQD